MPQSRTPPPAVPAHTLAVRQGSRQFVLPVPRLPAVIGRADGCDLVIRDPSVSSRHASLSMDGQGHLVIEDIGSTNGLYINYKKVKSGRVEPGVEIHLGQVVVQLQTAGHAALPGVDLPPGAAGPGPAVAAEARTIVAMPGTGHCFYRRGGKEFGPFSRAALRKMAEDGSLRRADLVWQDGGTAWLRADLVEGLFGKSTESPAAPAARRPRKSAGETSGYLEELLDFSRKSRRGSITCPHCWHTFEVEEFLYIARHQTLVGDPVLGPEAQQRFLPSKFTPEGNAVDSAGMSCPDMACPRCHLRIPQTACEMPPLFLSIVGAPASGKSYLLTAMIWELRNKLARNFAVSFSDTDAINNQILNDYEEMLFLNSTPNEPVALRKTELQGELYNQAMLDGMVINLPKPFMFSITPAEHHPQYQEVREKMSRTLVLYDNAGEHFEPGMDAVDNPTTRHLLHSDTTIFIFDPTKDVRFRSRCTGSEDPQLATGARVQRQEILLTEMINRIRKYSGMRAGSKTCKTLIVVVTKADVWQPLLSYPVAPEPWKWERKFNTCGLDVEEIKNVSFALRHLLESVCPELISTAESFAGDVLYVPTSALGRSPELHAESGMLGVRPSQIAPFWVSVPMLYFFFERGFIPALPRRSLARRDLVPAEIKVSGDVVFVSLPGRDKPLQVPVFYMGCRLRCPDTGQWFELPPRRRTREEAD